MYREQQDYPTQEDDQPEDEQRSKLSLMQSPHSKGGGMAAGGAPWHERCSRALA